MFYYPDEIVKKISVTSSLLAMLSILALTNCAELKLSIAGSEPLKKDALQGSSFYVEPVLENADTEIRTQDVGNNTTAVYRDKPTFAKKDARKMIRKKLAKSMHDKLGAQILTPQDGQSFLLVRTVITKQKTKANNLMLHYMACVFGMMCPATWIYNVFLPVHMEVQLDALVQLFEIPLDEVAKRQVMKPGMMYPVFNTDGLRPLAQKETSTVISGDRGLIDAFTKTSNDVENMTDLYADFLASEIANLVKNADTTESGAGGLGLQGSGPASGTEDAGDAANSNSQSW